MQTRLAALLLGIFYLLFGVLGLVSALYTTPPADAPTVNATASYGYLFGQFPLNAIEDAVNIAIGIAGIIAGSRLDSARVYCILLFFLLGIAACCGFIPQANTVGGMMPIFGSDTWIHLVTALVAGYFGYVAPESAHVEPAIGHAH